MQGTEKEALMYNPLCNKITILADYTCEHDLGELKKGDYDIKHMPRDKRKGGWIICLHKNKITCSQNGAPLCHKTMDVLEHDKL